MGPVTGAVGQPASGQIVMGKAAGGQVEYIGIYLASEAMSNMPQGPGFYGKPYYLPGLIPKSLAPK